MGTKDKIRQFIKYKGFTPYKFEKKCAFSNGILKTGKHFRADLIKPIRDTFPELNINWLLFDEGNMLLDTNQALAEPGEKYATKTENLENELRHCKELLAAKEETIAILKHKLGLEATGQSKVS